MYLWKKSQAATFCVRVDYSKRPLIVGLCLCQATYVVGAVYFVAPSGSDAGPGTIERPFATIMRAQQAATAGDTVYLRGGLYFLDHSHITATNPPWAVVNHINKNGVRYVAYAGERPVFDFSGVRPSGWRVTAFLVTADDCVFKGFDVVGVQITIQTTHTQSECFRVAGGNRNRFEDLAMHDGMGIGWYLTAGASNLVLNCDAYNNRGLDSGSLGNIDGFGVHPSSTNHTGNILKGCRAWFNSDDGFDLINAWAPVVIDNCWAFYNGYFSNFTSTGGDGNGFKAGGYGVSGGPAPIPPPRHRTQFCVAVRNRANGFYANHHTGGLDWFHNTGYANRYNFNMLCNLDAQSGSNDVPGFDHVMKNNLGFMARTAEVINLGLSNDVSFNYFTLEVTVASNDFASLDETLLMLPRRPDGSLPYIAFLRLLGSSELVDAGTDTGHAYAGAAPDLGAFEYGIQPQPVLAIGQPTPDIVLVCSGGWAGGPVELLTTEWLAPDSTRWESAGTNVFDVAGTCRFTLPVAAGLRRQFFRLALP